MNTASLPAVTRLKTEAKHLKHDICSGLKAPSAIGLSDDFDLTKITRSLILNQLAQRHGMADWTEFLRIKDLAVAQKRSTAEQPSETSNFEQWYLTEEGWLPSARADLTKLKKGRDIFNIMEAARHEQGGSMLSIWDCSAADNEAELKEDRLISQFGDRPTTQFSKWVSEYSDPRLF